MAVEILKNKRQDQVSINVNIYMKPGLRDTLNYLFGSLHLFTSFCPFPWLLRCMWQFLKIPVRGSLFPYSFQWWIPLKSHVFSYYLHSNVCLVCLPSFYVALGSGTSWNVLNDIGQCISKSPHDGSLANLGCTESSYLLLRVGGGRSTSNKTLILLIEYLSIRSLLIYWYLFVCF